MVDRSKEIKEFDYTFGKLYEAVNNCENNAIEWAVASTRSNEKALCKKEITENQYLDRQQKISGQVAGFSYNCMCSKKSSSLAL